MYELEVGTRILPPDTLPDAVRSAFAATRDRISAFSLTPWEEHCTECAMPACYSTCDLYAPRADGKCRRFLAGIEIVPLPGHPQGYVARVAFKRWAQLMAYANARLIPLEDAAAIEQRVRHVERSASALPVLSSISVAGRRGIPARLTRRWKQRVAATSGTPLRAAPDCLLVETHNPGRDAVRLSLTVANPGANRPPFQQLLLVPPGYSLVEIDASAIAERVDLAREMHITLNPNILLEEQEGLTLDFGLVAFIKRRDAPGRTADPRDPATKSVKAIKVAVWDLDNTLWSGTLVEDGPAALRLRDDAVAIIRELDRRGIVSSILSKNDHDDAVAVLKRFGVDDLFVYPRIGWDDKGATMTALIADFNVDASTFAFIDDQEFERARVAASNPGVRVYDVVDLIGLLDRPEFNPEQSAESASRRQFYRAEERRSRGRQGFPGDYLEFLRTCGLQAAVRHPDATTFDRVQELVQRTNQLNYSGTHYTRDEILELIARPEHECFTVSCTDAFGDYGTVGFMLVDRERCLLRDAMFSCRIQFKRVEHAMLTFLLDRYRQQGAAVFRARFRETKRNAPASAVFTDMGFTEQSREGAVRMYAFDLGQPIPHDRIVGIEWEGTAWEPSAIDSAV